jgi:hypothetical protein
VLCKLAAALRTLVPDSLNLAVITGGSVIGFADMLNL